MPTNKAQELILAMRYPLSLANLQQLLMDAEACAENYGKRSIFGRDKFPPCVAQFERTLGRCIISLAADDALTDPEDAAMSLAEVDDAMRRLAMAYGNWPLAFQFWCIYYRGATGERSEVGDGE